MPTPQASRIAEAALPHPVSRPVAASPGESDPSHRNLYCAHYGDCLQFAVRNGWPDWSCEACALNLAAKPPGAVQWAEARIRRD